MEKPINIYFAGTAGSGKTALTQGFQEWVKMQGYDAIAVNLDPGADFVPYPADIDIRDYIILQDIMDKYKLGPNGAQIVAADMIALYSEKIRKTADEFDTDFVLIDTPGQVELFTFREASKVILKALDDENSFIAFLFDSALCKKPSDFISLLLLSASINFRFQLPFANILTKADLISGKDREKIVSWSKDAEKLYSDILLEKPSMQKEASLELLKALEHLSLNPPLIPISSQTKEGMPDLYNAAIQFFRGGEDIEV